MGTAREINDRQDLADIHERGVGFVLYPFYRKLHSASCPMVPGMAEEPRWFAPDVAAARDTKPTGSLDIRTPDRSNVSGAAPRRSQTTR